MLVSVSRVVARSAIASSSRSSAFSTAAVRFAQPKAAAKPKGPGKASMLAAGKAMPGLSVLKDKPDPVALADEEYPAWLWTILDGPAAGSKDEGDKSGEFDFLAERRRLRVNNRTQIRAANFMKTT